MLTLARWTGMRILKRPAIPDNQALPKPLLADSKRLQRVRVINPQLLPEIAAAHSESGSESTPFSQPQRFHSLNVVAGDPFPRLRSPDRLATESPRGMVVDPDKSTISIQKCN